MLKRRVRQPRLAVLQRQRRGTIQPSSTSLTAVTLDRRTVQVIVDKLGLVCTRFKARELYSVLHILEQALRKANEQ